MLQIFIWKQLKLYNPSRIDLLENFDTLLILTKSVFFALYI